MKIYDISSTWSNEGGREGGRYVYACVEAEVVKETEKMLMLSERPRLGAFNYSTRVEKGKYATTERDAWVKFATHQAQRADQLLKDHNDAALLREMAYDKAEACK